MLDEKCKKKIEPYYLEWQENKKQYYIERKHSVKTIAFTSNNNNLIDKSNLNIKKCNFKIKKFENISKKEKRALIKKCNVLFIKLSEILIYQFYTTIIIDSKQKLQDENLNDRELKVIIWKRFIQTFTTILMQQIK